ncbi:S1C family serine protease [Aurantivibrio plasticivorans]
MPKFLKRFVEFSAWPVAGGLLVAIFIILAKPDWFFTHQHNDASQPAATLTPQQPLTPSYGVTGPVSYADAVNRAAPAVVNIYTTKPRPRHPLLDDPIFRQYFNFSEPPEQRRILSSMGSGVIVSNEGYILTNHHVISGADEYFVFLQDGRQVAATAIGADTDTDLAVLKIDLEDLTPINIGYPEQIQVGDVVLAIGNPFGFGQSVTQGIISATGRLGKTRDGVQSYIQTDAAINPGNSGGALVDVYGNLLGINTAIIGSQSGESIGIGFAIPANTAVEILNDIIEFNKSVHGYLGVRARPLTPKMARSLGLSFTNGLIVTRIDQESPAHIAGILPGDVITRVNSQPFEEDGSLMAREIAKGKPGDSVEIEVWRNGQPGVVLVTLGVANLTTTRESSDQAANAK